MNKKAFSFIEVIIVVTIIALLAVVGYSVNSNRIVKSNNSRVLSDIGTIKVGVESYNASLSTTLEPSGNTNYFSASGTYVHAREDAYGAYGKFTQKSIAKRYLDILPLDPRTNEYYSYGVKYDNNQFEIAGVVEEEGVFMARVTGNYDGVGGIVSLIREYIGPNYVLDTYAYLPYNPTERVLIVRDSDGNIYRSGDLIENNINVNLELYFADGSVSVLEPNSSITLTEADFPKDNLLASKVKVFLHRGSIWTKATHLDTDSSFEIHTADTVASVRGTIFNVNTLNSYSEVIVEVGSVEIIGKGIILSTGEKYNSNTNNVESESDIVVPEFTLPIETAINEIPESYELPEEDELVLNVGEIGGGENVFQTCFLENVEVAHSGSILAYMGDCSKGPITRQCNNGVLEGNADYMYASCSEKTRENCTAGEEWNEEEGKCVLIKIEYTYKWETDGYGECIGSEAIWECRSAGNGYMNVCNEGTGKQTEIGTCYEISSQGEKTKTSNEYCNGLIKTQGCCTKCTEPTEKENQCGKTQTFECEGLPTGAVWNVNNYTKVWNGEIWASSTPSPAYSTITTAICSYRCDTGYIRMNNECVKKVTCNSGQEYNALDNTCSSTSTIVTIDTPSLKYWDNNGYRWGCYPDDNNACTTELADENGIRIDSGYFPDDNGGKYSIVPIINLNRHNRESYLKYPDQLIIDLNKEIVTPIYK